MAAHVALTALLYVLLTLARAPAVWGLHRLPGGADAWQRLEPRIGANLSNQFEWPVFFHVVCLLHLLPAHGTAPGTLMLAWVFVGGRLLHSAVQIGTTNIQLRGLVFTLNFLAVLGLWTSLLFSTGAS